MGVLSPGMWYWIGVYPMYPLFQDFAAVLAAGEAVQAGADPYQWANSFDIYGRPHVYGPWMLWTAKLGLTSDDWWWMGIVIDVTFVVAVLAVLRPSNRTQAWVTGLILVSPPVLLALERANNDLIIFVMAAVVVALIPRGGWVDLIAAAGLLVVAAVFKFYPLAFFPVLLMAKRGGRAIWVLLGALVLLGWAVVHWWEHFRRGFAVMPVPGSLYSFGLRSSINSWTADYSMHSTLILGWVLGLAASVLALRRAWPQGRKLSDPMEVSPGYAIGALGWCSCYLINANYIYRYILLLFPAAEWIRQWQDPTGGKLAKAQIGIMLYMGMGWIPWVWIARNTDDLDSPWVPVFWFISGTIQGAALVLTLFVLFSLAVGGFAVARQCGWWPLTAWRERREAKRTGV